MKAEIHQQIAAGAALHHAQKFAEAAAIYEAVLAEDPGNADAMGFLASAYRSMGLTDKAIEMYEAIAQTGPVRSDFWYNRGNALNDGGRHVDAAASYAKALSIDPRNAAALANLAIAEVKLGLPEAALAHYRQALEIDPNHRIAAHNLGNLLADRGAFAEAVELLRRTVANWPDLAEGHYNLSLVLLRLGDFAGGFRDYEWRWETADFFKKPSYRGVPVWTGQSLQGRRLIVHSEQGLGDTIQFAKTLGMLASLGGDIVFHVPEKLETLMRTLPFAVTVTSAHGASDADFQIPLMSLPHRLKLTLGSVPSQRHYLSAEPERCAVWADQLRLDGAIPAVGVVWQGNPNSPAERGRSLASAEQLAPLATIAGVRLVALQKLDRGDLEPAATPSGWRVAGLSFMLEHPGPDLDAGADAFLDTAAIMSGLDLVVSVCTAPLHLAGALGRPSIALLRTVPDWRWLEGRDDTPWYPSMRLVRQARGEADFGPAIERASQLARSLLGIRAPSNE